MNNNFKNKLKEIFVTAFIAAAGFQPDNIA